MAKQLNVNLAFTADTGKAKAQLKDLQNQLNQVMNLSTKNVGGDVLAQDIEKASLAAAELKAHLEDATNVKTGKLDLGKLSEKLDTKKLKAYRNSLQAIGVEGQKAFMLLAQSISEAEVPLRRTSNLMNELWVTMKNTARWQLTSSAMHGFMSAVSSAYGYAQDLNESLNNIRIVSGASTEEMAKFAEQANKAAKALSATTTDYTNAALIYYQQGLSDEEIKKRAEITIKMANVTRDSAEVVSDQLTAVWNNFYKEGERGLQYYADVMTALGAATASSTDEIAGGLEKFASIADMIGLSFDYAATSLATITATTRQSEEVVGTALKTIFARIQGLKLGETLEDGTDLNKYSDSLKRVGIDIFDTAGQLKDMDNILEEIGARWESLAKSEQVALAQAVAGIRQYNQLVSLMDNWDYFQENLTVARNSEGALDEQAEIYAESWEAAQDRVRTALESIYSDVIKDDAFIDLLNNIEKVLTGVDKLIDSVGGLGGVLSALGVIGTKVFHDQIAAGLKNTAYSLDMTFGFGKEKTIELQRTALREAEKSSVEDASFSGGVKADIIKTEANLQRLLLENSSKMSQEEIRQNQTLLDRVKIYGEIAAEQAKGVQLLQQEEEALNAKITNSVRRRNVENFDSKKYREEINNYRKQAQWVGNVSTQLNRENKTEYDKKDFETLMQKLASEGIDFSSNIEDLRAKFEKDIKKGKKITHDIISDYIREELAKTEQVLKEKFKLEDKEIDVLGDKNFDIGINVNQTIEGLRQFDTATESASKKIVNFTGKQKEFSDVIIDSANTISSLIFSINALKSAFDVLNDPDMSFMDKFLSISMSLITIIPMLTTGIKGLKEIFSLETIEITKNTLAQLINTLARKNNLAATKEQIKNNKELKKQVKKGNIEVLEDTEKWTGQTTKLLGQLVIRFLPLLGKLAAVAAALAIVITAVQQLQKISPEGILKSTKEEAENAANAFEKISIKVNEVKNSIEGLESSYEKIENLTEGTLEWYQAVSEVNAEVLKLKNQFPELELTKTDNGILGFTQQSIKELEQKQIERLLTAQGIKLQSDKQVLEAEYNVEKNSIKTIDNFQPNYLEDLVGKEALEMASASSGEFIPEIQKYSQYDLIEGIAQYYNQKGNGEAIFADSEQTAKILAEGIYGITEKDARFNQVVNGLSELIDENEGQIRKLAEMQEAIEAYDSFIYDTKLSAIGTNRTSEELEIDSSEIFAQSKQDAKNYFEKEGGWNNHFNYSEFEVKNNQALQDFMALQGDEVEYVANRKGKLVLSIEGKEVEFSEEDVYDALAEYEISSNLEEAAVKKIRENLSKVISQGFNLEELETKELFNIDNFYKMVQNKYLGEITQSQLEEKDKIGETNPQAVIDNAKEQADETFKAIMSAAQDYGNFEEITEMMNSIKWDTNNSRTFDILVESFNQGKIGIEDFTYSLEKLNTQTELSNLSKFEEIGKVLGLNDEETKVMQEYAKHIAEIAEESELFSDQLATNTDGAMDLAVEITRMNKGVSALAEGFADWNSILKNSEKESSEYVEALLKTKTALSDILDVESDLISNEFIAKNLDQIKLAAEGNDVAIDALRAKMDEEIITNISLGQTDEFIEKLKDLDASLQSIIPEDIEVGMVITGEDEAYKGFIEASNKLVEQAGMTADEANAYFAGIGYEPVYSQTDVDNSMQAPNVQTTTSIASVNWEEAEIDLPDILGGPRKIKLPSITMNTSSTALPPTESESDVRLVSFSGEEKPPEIKGFRKKASGSFNNYSPQNNGGKTAGGGGSKSKPKAPRQSDTVERYKEITDQLNDVQDAASDASKAMDRMYGANRLKAFEKQNSLIEQEINLLKQKKKEAQAYLAIDKTRLQADAKKAGVDLQFDESGNITNYTESLTELHRILESAYNAAGKDIDEYEQETIDRINDEIEELKKSISQYEDTRKILTDIDNSVQDKLYEIQDNNYEKFTYSLELKLEINDMELERLDYFLNKFSDNFYKMAESAGLMIGQFDPNKENLQNNKNAREELDKLYKDRLISQADYIDGLKKIRQNIYDTLETLNELDKTMLHYYEDTLSAATEELADHTDHMEHLTGVFDHYISLMNILGKSKNYDAIGDFLGGKADTIKDRLNTAQEYYDVLLRQKEDAEVKLNTAIARGDDAAIELYKEEWDAIVDEVDAAQEQVLSLTEEWAEAMKAVIENNMAQIAETLEKTLTGGLNFDQLMDGFDKLNTRQEEYLTKTNQIYETNKLMRTASKALDETDNTIAKTKLKNFIEETKSLQNNTKLSKYELEIQQAKYDLLLAEIALEEAQNAKSTVRLSRDNEGNFGYVYTADQDAIDDAQQGVEDAENRLYNISLDGQQEYTEKYLQAQQEMYNELTELQQMYLDGQIASEEEYERRKEEILNHYLNPDSGILSTYSHLYNIAVQTDADATADYWAKDYAQMTQNTEEWRDAVNEYLVEIEDETEKWRDVSTQANREVQGALEDSSKATEELTDESRELARELEREVIPAIERELDWIKAQTAAYASQRAELLKLIEAMEDYAAEMEKDIKSASQFDPNKDYAYDIVDKASKGDIKGAYQSAEERENKVNANPDTYGIYDAQEGKELANQIMKLSQADREALNKDITVAKEVGYGNNTISEIVNKYLKKAGIVSAATGGYTGAWGPEGKLAILHEKELVLNAEDTSNLLTVISFVRDLVSLIDGQAQMASFANLSAATNIHSTGQTLEQSVSIHAEFPNATDRYEIEEAFNTLVNKASQFANRK